MRGIPDADTIQDFNNDYQTSSGGGYSFKRGCLTFLVIAGIIGFVGYRGIQKERHNQDIAREYFNKQYETPQRLNPDPNFTSRSTYRITWDKDGKQHSELIKRVEKK